MAGGAAGGPAAAGTAGADGDPLHGARRSTFDALAAQLSAVRPAPLTSSVLRAAEDAMRDARAPLGGLATPPGDRLPDRGAARRWALRSSTTTATTTRSQRSWSSSRSGWRPQERCAVVDTRPSSINPPPWTLMSSRKRIEGLDPSESRTAELPRDNEPLADPSGVARSERDLRRIALDDPRFQAKPAPPPRTRGSVAGHAPAATQCSVLPTELPQPIETKLAHPKIASHAAPRRTSAAKLGGTNFAPLPTDQ